MADYGRGVNRPWQPDELPTDLGCTRDSGERAEVVLTCEVRQGTRPWRRVRLKDISRAGFKLDWTPAGAHDIPLRIRIPGLQMLSAHVRWSEGREAGCAFVEPLHIAVFEHIVRQARAASQP